MIAEIIPQSSALTKKYTNFYITNLLILKNMGQVLGMISAVLILSAIYFRVGGQKNFSNGLFIVGIIGEILFIAIMIMAIFD
ncbi:MAG: hypothetical protein US30_C0020G0011 [Candidatus Moranbacteria bacterium GW2011_GWF2_36_839]|nr:MAG: hypothetical protein US27_C0021G0011 [Candidatus Moranbacteria bacterium GW2011_GWF1_36_78]KKQ16287.1 MAG: hypothetical protein US30_C0020G0011 [Candidatus Moranbacteria bacterium GW2011_GWF2_36_839]HBY11115.1 hypothetical protein [Candidatus Moranbacteria bacterium]